LEDEKRCGTVQSEALRGGSEADPASGSHCPSGAGVQRRDFDHTPDSQGKSGSAENSSSVRRRGSAHCPQGCSFISGGMWVAPSRGEPISAPATALAIMQRCISLVYSHMSTNFTCQSSLWPWVPGAKCAGDCPAKKRHGAGATLRFELGGATPGQRHDFSSWEDDSLDRNRCFSAHAHQIFSCVPLDLIR
jgi:hypothetical protein